MPRVKRGNKRRERRKKILSLAKGYFLTKGKLYRSAQESIMRAGNFAYAGRKRKKRDFRRLWIIRINAATRALDMSYSQFIAGLKRAGRGPRPQVAGRDRGPRSQGLRRAGRVGAQGIGRRREAAPAPTAPAPRPAGPAA